jgi:hypothetical protein
MAVYVGSSKRRNRTRGVAIVALIIGIAIGFAIGRDTATTIDDKIASGRSGGRDLVAALDVLPLEYEQAISGSSETNLIADTVKRSTARLPAALDGAPWLGPAQRSEATAAVRSVEAAATAKVAPRVFKRAVTRAGATLQKIFGLSGG